MTERVRIAEASDYFPPAATPTGFIPSGCTVLDCALGGGWPLGRVVNIVGDKSTGKDQPLYAKVLTPQGWTTMGEVKPGDLVIGGNGKPIKVTAVHPQGERDVFRLHFSDGTNTECGLDHLWSVNRYKKQSRAGKPEVLTLRDMLAAGLHSDKSKTGYRFYFPFVEPVEFTATTKPKIDYYLLGALLGDGSLTTNTPGFSTRDFEILEALARGLPASVKIKKKQGSNCDYTLTPGRTGGKANPLTIELRRLGVMGKKSQDKFIPREVFTQTPENRLALLRGLMDTDGYACGTASFSSTSYELARGVLELARSLGGRCNLKPKPRTHKPEYPFLPSYDVSIKMPVGVNPFALPRKAARYKDTAGTAGKSKSLSRTLTNVEYVGRTETKCITVDSDDGLYVTDDYVVTHNTLLAIEAVANFKRLYPNGIAVYNETEAAFDTAYAESLGINMSGVRMVGDCFTVEDMFANIDGLVKELDKADNKEPVIYIVDSLDALSDEGEMSAEFNAPTYGAKKAQRLSKFFRQINKMLSDRNFLLIFVSQIRDNIGVTFGKKYTRSGGHSLDFYATQVVWLAHLKRLEKQVEGVKRVVGVRIKANIEKNKIAPPFRMVEMPIIFGYGIDDITASVDWLDEVIGKRGDASFDLLHFHNTGDKEIAGINALRKFIDKVKAEEKGMAQLVADLDAVVKSRWEKIENSFKPSTRKYR